MTAIDGKRPRLPCVVSSIEFKGHSTKNNARSRRQRRCLKPARGRTMARCGSACWWSYRADHHHGVLPRRHPSGAWRRTFTARPGRNLLLGGVREGTAAPGATTLYTVWKRTKSPAAPRWCRCQSGARGRGCWQPPPPPRCVFPRRRSRVQRFDASTGTGTAAWAPTAAS